MRVGADQGVGIGQRLAGVPVGADEDDAGEIFKIDLVDDAGIRRNDGEVLERALSPTEECVTFFVALELEVSVELKGLRGAELVDLYGVVDDQLGRLKWVDQVRIAAQGLHGIAHGSQVDHCGYAGEVLQQHAARHEGDLLRRNALAGPGGEGANVVGLYGLAVFPAQQVLQQNAQRKRQVPNAATMLFQGIKTVNLELAIAHAKNGTTAKAVHG